MWLGGISLAVILGGAFVAAATEQIPNFLSSAIGTAAGGMVAVWAAFLFWAQDTWDDRERRRVDEINLRNQRLSDEQVARQARKDDFREQQRRAMEERSRETALQILDRALAVRAIARKLGRSQCDDEIAASCDWIRAHSALICDEDMRRDLEEAIDMLNPSPSMEKFTDIPYTQRVWPVVTWISATVKRHVQQEEKPVDRPECYAELKTAIEDYREDEIHFDSLYQQQLMDQLEKSLRREDLA